MDAAATGDDEPRPVRRLPLVDVTAPIACTLDAADVPGRIALLGRLRDAATDVARTEHGLVLRFPDRPEVEADVRRFAVDEQRCCTFWAFAVEEAADEVVLTWDGPATTTDLLDHLHRFLVGDAEVTSLEGLL